MANLIQDLPRLTNDPWINLATAVAVQAILDARSLQRELREPAREWLRSEHGSGFLHGLKLDPEVLLDWLEKVGDGPNPARTSSEG
jgi:hypothetical protein